MSVSKCVKKDSGRKEERDQMINERQWKEEGEQLLFKKDSGRKNEQQMLLKKDSERQKEGELMLKERQWKEERG